jgi:hypothetical protein
MVALFGSERTKLERFESFIKRGAWKMQEAPAVRLLARV